MLNDSAVIPTGNYYSIDFDTTLGRAVSDYIERCRVANQAADDFVSNIHQQYKFPALTPDDTLHFSDDCDAGGLLYISISNDRLQAIADKPDYVFWASLPDPDDSSRTIWFPRIEVSTAYIRLGQAVQIMQAGRKDWEFVQKGKADRTTIKSFLYGDVSRRLTPANRQRLLDSCGRAPSYSTRLALGRNYYLSTDDGKGTFTAPDEQFQAALDLFKAWNGLPRVPANSLSRILHLQLPQSVSLMSDTDKQKFSKESTDMCFCSWQTDTGHNRYIIHTGLVSDLNEMQRIEHP